MLWMSEGTKNSFTSLISESFYEYEPTWSQGSHSFSEESLIHLSSITELIKMLCIAFFRGERGLKKAHYLNINDGRPCVSLPNRNKTIFFFWLLRYVRSTVRRSNLKLVYLVKVGWLLMSFPFSRGKRRHIIIIAVAIFCFIGLVVRVYFYGGEDEEGGWHHGDKHPKDNTQENSWTTWFLT